MLCSAQLLQEVCSDLAMNPSVYDITVEDPSDGFVRLRDFVDCRNALGHPAFLPPSIHGPFEGAIATAARDVLKLHKVPCVCVCVCVSVTTPLPQSQARRVYEILRLWATDRSDPADQYRAYRLAVKNRLNAPHQVPRPLSSHTLIIITIHCMTRERFRSTFV